MDNKHLAVTVDIPETLPQVLGMPIQIKRILGNLLQNAIRYSPEQSELKMKVEPSPNGYVTITVIDQGEGIPEVEQERIFDRFYRTDKSRHREKGGAGLGLAIAQTLVAMQGGLIGVHSRVGEGSQFWFTLPIESK
jgi:two-component system sensor histidine kinase SaeS